MINTKASKKGLSSPNFIIPVGSPCSHRIIRKMGYANVELKDRKVARHGSQRIRRHVKIRGSLNVPTSNNCGSLLAAPLGVVWVP